MTNKPRFSRARTPITATLLFLTALLVGACDEDAPPPEGHFPEGFTWGTAVAGFQVDMGCPTLDASACLDPNSDWYVWVTTQELIDDPGTHLSGDPMSYGPGMWELYAQDFDRARDDLGLTGFRLSIEWSRIFPRSTVGIDDPTQLEAVADATNIAHYRAMLTALRDRGIEPLVTLHHYTLPVWMHDAVGCHFDLDNCSPRGWLDRETIVEEIAKYSGFVAAAFGDLVDKWATQNEPFAVVLAGYLQPGADRTNPPGVGLSFDEVKASSFAMVEAHARMYDAVKAGDTTDADGDGETAQVGLVFAVAPSHPLDPLNEDDVTAVDNVEYLYNWAFLDGVVLGLEDEELSGVQTERADLVGRMDWLGLNFYAVTVVEGTPWPTLPDLSPLSTFNPLSLGINYDVPSGIYEALTMVRDRYPTMPIYITENGTPNTADGETQRRYLVEHLTWVSRAWRDGVDVRGYFYWSFVDNYEWNHGMGMQFGLYAMDPLDPQKVRTARPVVDDYARIIQDNRIPSDLLDRYPVPKELP